MSDENTNKLEWTGERYVPEISGAIRLEHVHRYLLAREISRDKRVLDIACGEGYGADLLASVASHVIGVDNAPHVVAHASRRYTRPNVEFIHGACEAIPLPDDSVDIVVSFETLEHVQRQHDMMQEIRRVLRADGLLMISNPERHEYSEVLGNSNPYHVSELYRDEFERLLRSHFKHVAVSGQRVQGGSLVAPLDASTSSNFVTFPASTDLNAPLAEQGIRAPVYLLAIASDIPLPTLPTGLLDGGDFAWAADLQGLQSQVQGQCTVEIARRFGEVIELEGASIADIRGAFNRQAERVSAAVSTMAASEEQRDQAQRRIRELELLTGTLIAELQHTRAHAETIENQLLEGNARLAAAHSDLTASRAIAKAHATAEEWLERKAHRLEAEIEVQRRSLALSEEQLAVARAQLSDVQRQLTASQVLQAASQDQLARLDAQRISSEARVAASHEKLAHLRSLIFSLQTQIEVYEQSRSWRLTAPLRAARRLGRATSRGASPISDLHQVLADESVEVASPSPGGPLAPGVVTRAAPAAVVESALGRPESASPQGAQPLAVLPKRAYKETTEDYIPLNRAAPVETRIKLIAFYLPQFHPIPENDAWWGKGFTEWTSVTRAKPQFEGHYQPHLPGELGFYDLRLPDTQRRQIELAKIHGIHGFCYYHYWFHGKKLLQRPLDQLLAAPDLDFPFCLCWANENWTRRWDGGDDEWLMTQQHSPEDDLAFIRDIEPALRDRRYIRVGDRPLLLVYRPALFPDAAATALRWRTYCREVGIGELFLMSTHAFDHNDPRDFGFDAALEFAPNTMPPLSITDQIPNLNPDFRGEVYDYRYLVEATLRREAPDGYPLFRSVVPMWDNEPRRPNQGAIFGQSSPTLYRHWLESTCRWTERHVGIDKPLVFVNAWNEWAEGAHLEPDQRHGYAYLNATAEALEQFPIRANQPSIVCVSHDAYFHGAQLIALNLARTLSSRLHYNVEVILCGPGPLTTEFEAIARVHDFGQSGLRTDDKLAVIRRLHDEGARIAICNTGVVGETVELLKLAGFSVISLIHELPDLIRAYGLEASVQRIAHHADHVVFPASVVRESFMSLTGLAPERTLVEPQGLFAPNEFFGRRELARHELRAQLGLPEQTRIVLAVGYADHRKGIDLFGEVGIGVARRAEDVVFVWVGNHEPTAFANAQARVQDAGLSDRFMFPGPVRNSDLYFAGADVYLMTSREDPFPSVVLEALDASLPVIGFEGAGGFVELLRRSCGLLVPFGDTGSMTDAVLRVLGSPAEAERLAIAGREILARDFSFVNYARALVELADAKRPRVSVIVPNYNYRRYLGARLKSIIDQTYPPYEVLFLDDFSTDDSIEIATELLHGSGLAYRIIANETNQGTYPQWLRGIGEAKGDLIWIAEADDECAPTFLESLVGQFARPEVVLAYCQSRQIDEEDRELAPDYLNWTADISETKWREGYVRSGVEEICDTLAVKNTIPNVSAVLMRRPDVSGIERKLMTLKNAGDWLLYVHLLEQGSIAFVSDALNSHRRHASSVTLGGDGLNLMREILMVQQHVIERYRITSDTARKRDNDLQRTYEYLGLASAGPASYKDHEALRAVEWAAPG